MQINSQPTEIIIYFVSKVIICVGDDYDSYESNYVREFRLGFRLGLIRYNPSGYRQDGPAYNAFRCFSLFTGQTCIKTQVVICRTVLHITSAFN